MDYSQSGTGGGSGVNISFSLISSPDTTARDSDGGRASITSLLTGFSFKATLTGIKESGKSVNYKILESIHKGKQYIYVKVGGKKYYFDQSSQSGDDNKFKASVSSTRNAGSTTETITFSNIQIQYPRDISHTNEKATEKISVGCEAASVDESHWNGIFVSDTRLQWSTRARESNLSSITYDPPYCDDISVSSNPTKTTYYNGEAVDWSGLVVQARMYRKHAGTYWKTINVTESTTKKIRNDSGVYREVTNIYNSDKPFIYVYYDDYYGTTKSSGIFISIVYPISLSVDSPNKIHYKYGEELDSLPTQGVVTFARKYQGGTLNIETLIDSNYSTSTESVTASHAYNATPTELDKSYTITFGCNLYGIDLETSYTVYVHTARDINIIGSPDDTFDVGDVFTTGTISVKANYYENRSTSTEPFATKDVSDDVVISEPDMGATSYFNKSTQVDTRQDVTVSYYENAQAIETSYKVTIHGMTNFEFSQSVTKTLKGNTDWSPLTGLSVWIYTSKEEEIALDLTKPADLAMVSFDYDESILNSNGNKDVDVIVKYKNKGNAITKSYSLEVYSIESIESIDFKDIYYLTEGSYENLDLSGLTVTGKFSDGTTSVLNSSGFDLELDDTAITTSDNRAVTQDMTLKVTTKSSVYGDEVSAEAPITLFDNKPASIISVNVTKTQIYEEGDTFTGDGISVTCLLADNVTIKTYETNIKFYVHGTETLFNNHVFSNSDSTSYELDVVYGELETETTVTVTLDKLLSLAISNTTNPYANKVYKAGTVLTKDSFSQLTFTASYHVSGDKALTSSDITFSPLGKLEWDDETYTQTISCNYKAKTITFNITVISVKKIVATITKEDYIRSQTFDKTTLSVEKIYTNDDNEENGEDITSVIILPSDINSPLVPDDRLTSPNKVISIGYTDEAAKPHSTSVTIKVKCLNSVTVSGVSSGQEEDYGYKFSVAGRSLTLAFNYGDNVTATVSGTNQVTIGGVTYPVSSNPSIGSRIVSKTTNCYVSVTYGGETINSNTWDLDIVALHSLELVSAPTKTAYYSGETFDTTGLSVKAVYYSTADTEHESPTKVTLTSDEYTVTGIYNGQILNNDSASPISKTATVTFSDKEGQTASTTFNVTVTAVALLGIEITHELNNYSYVEGDSLSIDGLVVYPVFNNPNSNLNPLELNDLRYFIDGHELTSHKDRLTASQDNKVLEVSYTYNGVTKTATTTGKFDVDPVTLTSIVISNEDELKKNYYIGDKLDLSNMKLKLIYNGRSDDYKEILYKNVANIITDYDSYKTSPFTDEELGEDIEVTVSYTDNGVTETTSFEINVLVPTISKLYFDFANQMQQATHNKTFNLNNLIVIAEFSNGHQETLSSTYWTSDVLTVLGIGNDGLVSANNFNESYTVTITATNPYNNNDTKTGTIQIGVNPNVQLKEIFVDVSNAKTVFRAGDAFSIDGLVVEGYFTDTDGMVPQEEFRTEPAVGAIFREGGTQTIKVIVNYKNEIKTAEYQVRVLMSYESGNGVPFDYKLAFAYYSGQDLVPIEEVTKSEEVFNFTNGDQYPLYLVNDIDICEDTSSEFYGRNILKPNVDKDTACIGVLKFGVVGADGYDVESASLIRFEDDTNPIEGSNNIEVLFPHYRQDYADSVDKCKFAIVYNESVFASGNPNQPNVDYRSSLVNASQVENYKGEATYDYSYFGDTDYKKYGTPSTAVVGYDIFNDGSLVIYKESSNHEPTIYTRTLKYVDASTGESDTSLAQMTLYDKVFPETSKNIGGISALNFKGIVNFRGESLFISKTGLKVLTAKSGVYNSAKYAYDRSYAINKLFTKDDLRNAITHTFNERLYIATNRGIYVTDLEAITKEEYEWYFFNIEGVNCFFELDDQLFFAVGKDIYRFTETEHEYADKRRTYIGTGGITLDTANNKVVFSVSYTDKVVEGNKFNVITHYSPITGDAIEEDEMYALLGGVISQNYRSSMMGGSSYSHSDYIAIIENTTRYIRLLPYNNDGLTINEDKLKTLRKLFYEGRRVYVDNINVNVGGDGIRVSNYYTLHRVNQGSSDYWQLLNEAGEPVTFSDDTNSFRLSFRVSEMGCDATLTNIGDGTVEGSKTAQLIGDHNEILNLIHYNHTANEVSSSTFSGVITEENTIVSYFITKPFDLEDKEHGKTVLAFSINNDTEMASYMDIGYMASRSQADFITSETIKGGRQTDFRDFNVDKTQFTNDKLPHLYTQSKVIHDIGYIKFLFKNDRKETNMVLDRFSVLYATGRPIKGVK